MYNQNIVLKMYINALEEVKCLIIFSDGGIINVLILHYYIYEKI